MVYYEISTGDVYSELIPSDWLTLGLGDVENMNECAKNYLQFL